MTIDLEALTGSELNDLQTAIAALLVRRNDQPAVIALIRVSLAVGGYNARRYNRPWIGLVTSWPVGGRPEIDWGRYCGDDSGGELEIMARPGDIIRTGQKDNRGNGGSNTWHVVEPDGSLREIDQPEARKLYKGGN